MSVFLVQRGHDADIAKRLLPIDGVDKVGDEAGGALKLGFCRSFARRPL
jgi:hypothetical protein